MHLCRFPPSKNRIGEEVIVFIMNVIVHAFDFFVTDFIYLPGKFSGV
jgi:hypothetical protein